jgi:hypothetical protein
MTMAAPFYLLKFGDVTLPTNQGTFAWPSETPDGGLRTLGGAFDSHGSGYAGPQLPYRLTYTVLAVHATDTTELRIALDALRAMTSTKPYARLWLKAADGPERWAWARMLNVTPALTATGRAAVSTTLTWRVDSGWHGDAHGGEGDVPTALTSSPQAITVGNGGDAPVDDALITVWAGSTAITYLRWQATVTWGEAAPIYCDMAFTGTIKAGEALSIGCKDCTVLNNNNDAYNDLHRLAAHNCPSWLRLVPGSGDSGAAVVTVTWTGGAADSTILCTYWDAFA